MIEVRELSRSYGEVRAVRNVSFTVERGEIAGLLGPNGAGKTTMLRLLTGVLRPDGGTIRVAGTLLSDDPKAVKRRIGYLPENAPVYGELNVAEYLDFLAGVRGLTGSVKLRAIERVCEECGVADAYRRPLGLLSKGYRQRAALAGALVHEPEILILDEPTTGLDPRQIHEIRELIRRLGAERTILLSTHILQEAEALCSNVLIVRRGELAARGAPGEITAAAENGNCYRVAVKDLDPVQLREKLASLNGYQPAAPARRCRGGSEAELCSEESDADGSRIFSWAVEEGLHLLWFYPVRASLEQIFLEVTEEEGGEQ
jgi:ABC-2 type transport system ATP-binding protein